jgi:hypothetical protein
MWFPLLMTAQKCHYPQIGLFINLNINFLNTTGENLNKETQGKYYLVKEMCFQRLFWLLLTFNLPM